MAQFSTIGIIVICAAAFFTGVSKSGVPLLVTLLSPVVAMIMPVRESVGFLLPILIFGDVISVIYYRRVAKWQELLKVLPWAVVGIVIGFFLMKSLADQVFKPILGLMIVVVTTLNILKRVTKADFRTNNRVMAALIGILAGIFTMMANAAAPLLAMYLLSMDMPKEDFVGTNAWFFMSVNILKLPFSAALGIVTWSYFKVDLMLYPLVLVGIAAGIYLLKRIPQRAFDITIQALSLLAGFKLLF